MGVPVDFLGDRHPVNALDHAEQPHRITAFVRLQMADQLPLEVAGAGGDLQLGLLDFAFAEDAAAVIGQLPHGVGAVVFGDRQQHDLRRVTAGAVAGGADPVAEGVQSFVQFHAPI